MSPLPMRPHNLLTAAAQNPQAQSDYLSALSADWAPDLTIGVVLAACKDHKQAFGTSVGGLFTTALITTLHRAHSAQSPSITHDLLINSIGWLPSPADPQQKPIVVGTRTDQPIFDML